MAAAEGDDADVFGYHYENGMLAVNLFHMRGGNVVDRREFFWEDLPEFDGSRQTAGREGMSGTAPPEHVGRASAPSQPSAGRAQTSQLPRLPTDHDLQHLPANSSPPC